MVLELILGALTPTTLLVFVVTLLLTYYVTKSPRMLRMPPGPFPLPILGNFLEFQKDPGDSIHVFQSIAKKYGKLCTLKIGQVYALIISDYNILVEAFVKKADTFSDRPIDVLYAFQYINNKLGRGIVTNNGHSWKQLRRTTLVAMRDFGVGKQSLEEKITEEIQVLMECIEDNKGQPFVVKPLFNLATSNVICGVVFGSRFDYDDAKFKELLRVLDESLTVNPMFAAVNFFPYLKYVSVFKKTVLKFAQTLLTTMSFIKELTASNEATYDENNIRDFVDLFIKTKRELKEDSVFDENNMLRVVVDLFTAGSDTTANTLSWLMLYMAKFPDIQTRCQKQIDQVLGKGKRMTLADKDKLSYVEATILEVLRLRPPAPMGVIHSTNKDTELSGYHIPKGTVIFNNILDINANPETFPDPQAFNPEHFLDQQGNIVHRDRMVSFSVGPRSCLGEILAKMELSLFFTSILQFYTVSAEQGHDIDLSPTVTLLLRHEVQNLVFTRRD